MTLSPRDRFGASSTYGTRVFLRIFLRSFSLRGSSVAASASAGFLGSSIFSFASVDSRHIFWMVGASALPALMSASSLATCSASDTEPCGALGVDGDGGRSHTIGRPSDAEGHSSSRSQMSEERRSHSFLWQPRHFDSMYSVPSEPPSPL